MLNRKDFIAIFIGQVLVTMSLMTLAAKSQCVVECEGVLSLFAAIPIEIADVN